MEDLGDMIKREEPYVVAESNVFHWEVSTVFQVKRGTYGETR